MLLKLFWVFFASLRLQIIEIHCLLKSRGRSSICIQFNIFCRVAVYSIAWKCLFKHVKTRIIIFSEIETHFYDDTVAERTASFLCTHFDCAEKCKKGIRCCAPFNL